MNESVIIWEWHENVTQIYTTYRKDTRWDIANVVWRISGKTFKFNQNDPVITSGRHDWNVFVAWMLKLTFVFSEERLGFWKERIGMVSMEIWVLGPREELGDVSIALPGGLNEGTVCSSPPALCPRKQLSASLLRPLAGRIFPLLCFHALITPD